MPIQKKSLERLSKDTKNETLSTIQPLTDRFNFMPVPPCFVISSEVKNYFDNYLALSGKSAVHRELNVRQLRNACKVGEGEVTAFKEYD